MGPDKFEPQKTKAVKASSTKRVAILLSIACASIMLFVTYSIMTSGQMRSAEPKKLVEAAQVDSDAIEQASKLAKEKPEFEEPEEEPYYTENTPVDDYVMNYPIQEPEPPAHRVGDKKRELHTIRIMAANAKSSLDGFTTNDQDPQKNTTAAASNSINGLGNLEEQLRQAEAEYAAAVNGANVQNTNNSLLGSSAAEAATRAQPQNSRERLLAGDGRLPDGYSPYSRIKQLTQFEVKAGTIIPCVLISGVNSDLPGNSIGQVTEDVFDSATGQHLLIPKGSKIIGTYDSHIEYGQSRVLVVWSKLVYPDGSTLMLTNLSAADQSGYTGVKGKVNRHWNSIISASLIVSLMGAGVEMASPESSSNSDTSDPKSILAENAARSVAEAMSKIIQREVDRQPTIKIRPGYRFLLFVRQDMLFDEQFRR